MTPRLKAAVLLAFGLHGLLIVTARYRLSYDAYTHMFFADHYLRGWWSLWEPRWYAGFEVVSYPPLVHQLLALSGSILGVDRAFGLLLWGVLSAYPLAVHRFSRIFTGPAASGNAALAAALLPSLFLAAHTFGQLPTLFSTLLALWGAAALYEFLRRGAGLDGALAVALFAAAMAGHHATLLFQPFLAGAVLLRALSRHAAHKGQIKGVGRPEWLSISVRFGAYVVLALGAGLAVVWPFWAWGSAQAMQAPIDHLSRHNFFTEPLAAGFFFLPVYGLFIPFIPLALQMGLHRRLWGPGAAFTGLFVLGLGGTTPLPRWLFGAEWEWLTYDRFALWASLLLLPFVGLALARLRRRRAVRLAAPYAAALAAICGLVIGLLPSWLPTQPPPLDLQPIVDFLAQGDRAQYRYLTFGFGDQMARLSRLAPAATLDGSYHTARQLPELQASGIGQIDAADWLPGGLQALDPILKASEARGVRWGFVNLRRYAPLLDANGWVKLGRLPNGVQVWENPAAMLPPPVKPPVETPLAIFSWGALPLLALYIAAALVLRRYGGLAGARALEVVKALAVGLLPLALTLWYYRPLVEIEQPRVYFTYSSALFFASDGLALAAVLAWLAGRLLQPGAQNLTGAPRRERWALDRPEHWLLGVCLLAGMSTLWSIEPRTSFYFGLHLALCFGLYLSLRDTPQAWRWFAFGCCAALGLQFLLGGGEFISQSTALAAPLGLRWPGLLEPSMPGASVVALSNGWRWLRAYGSLPHPNLLGGFTAAMLAGPLALYLQDGRRRLLPAIFFLIGLALLALTFSRSAWLAAGTLGAVVWLQRGGLERKNLRALNRAGLAALLLLGAWLRPLLLPRLGQAPSGTEQVSNFTRTWLAQRAAELIQQNPLLGSGAGTFPLALSHYVAAFYKIEPVHNLPLLLWSDLGLLGVILAGGLVVTVFRTSWSRAGKTAQSVVFSGALLGLMVIGLLDHYLWTLAPGRMLAAAMLGLWAEQMRIGDGRG